jgi:hypothetical protein
MRIEYDEAAKETFDAATAKISRSFRG